MLRASAGSGNAAIGSRALIGRAWSCRSPFGRCAPFDHQRKLCGSFLAIHALRRNHDRRERIALIIKRREGDGRLAGAKCCRAARSNRPISDITPVYSITSAGVTSNADETFRPKSWRSCLEGLACRKSVPSWLRGTIVHLQRAGLTMKTWYQPKTPRPCNPRSKRRCCSRSAPAPISRAFRVGRHVSEQKYFYYFAIRQANSTTVAPSAAAITDVTIPPPSARSTAM